MEPLRIVCFGDSITGPFPGTPYRHQYLKFADLLQLMLEARPELRGSIVFNRGLAGQTSAEACGRLQGDVLAERPDIAFVLLGANDLRSPAEKAEVAQHLLAIVTELQAAHIKVLLGRYHQEAPESATHWGAVAWRELDEVILRVAADRAVPTVSFAGAIREATLTSPEEPPVGEDKVHLNPLGDLIYVRTLFRHLDELGWLVPARRYLAGTS